MTDKQIIIDGIDVAGCVYYKQECIANCGMFALGDFKCEGQICLYKQLKRKQKECEELKKTIMYKCPQCGEEYLNPIGASLYEENNKLKQTLIEIKDIAEEQQSWNEINSQHAETESEDDIFAYNCSALKQILQKISECKGEYNEKIR